MTTPKELHSQLTGKIIDDFFGFTEPSCLRIHDWEILDFSSVFSIEYVNEKTNRGVFIKIPKKKILYFGVASITEHDRKMGQEEFKSLTYINEIWPKEIDEIGFVRPLKYYHEYNAIVTERFYGNDLIVPFKVNDLLYRFGYSKNADRWVQNMHRIGRALGILDKSSAPSSDSNMHIQGGEVFNKLKFYLDKIEAFGVSRQILDRVEKYFDDYRAAKWEVPKAVVFKGLDIRNILLDNDNRIYLLDPGKMKQGICVENLACFLVTHEILYWGTGWFFLRIKPGRKYYDAIIDGYFDAQGAVDEKLLNLYILKQYIKHWKTAHIALRLKKWPRIIKFLLRNFYIDPFYSAQIDRLLKY